MGFLRPVFQRKVLGRMLKLATRCSYFVGADNEPAVIKFEDVASASKKIYKGGITSTGLQVAI